MPKNGNTPKTLLESLDALVAKHHLLKHPFYKAWTDGQLSKADLGLYAEQYYQHVRSFPENLKQLAQSLGVSDASLEDARPLPGIAALLDTYDEVAAQGSMTQAVAAFYVYEAQVPEIASQKISGLRRFYGISE